MRTIFPHRARPPARLALAALALAVVAPALAGCAREPSAPLKNLVLITIDTLRSDKLGAYGHPVVRTPTMDWLSRHGTLFPATHSAIPLTLPSHTSMMTGLYPRSSLVLSHAYTLAPERVTLAEVLAEHGYSNVAFISSQVLRKEYGLDQGFEGYFERPHSNPAVVERLKAAGADLTAKTARVWLKRNPPQPFFVWIHLFHPHKPYEPPPPLDRLYDDDYHGDIVADVPTLTGIWENDVELAPEDLAHIVALYEGEVTSADLEVGRIIELLRSEGLLSNTIVALTSDHGEVLYEHDNYFGHDIMLYEPSINVPMILYGDGVFPAGRVVDGASRLIDVAPTLLDALGLPADALGPTDGISLMPMVRAATGESDAASAAAETLYAEVFPPKREWKTEPRHALRTRDWKMMQDDGSGRLELYNLRRDPYERTDLSQQEPDTLAAFLAALESWQKSKAEHFVVNYPELDAETEARLRALGYLGN